MASDPTTIIGEGLTGGVQLAWVTNDTNAAIKHFESRLGIGPWVTRQAQLTLLDGPAEAATGCSLIASFAYMTGRMFELIEAVAEAPPIFPKLPTEGLSIVPHHVGAFMDDADDVVAGAKAAGLAYHRFGGARGDIVFVDTRESVGLWLEALCFENTSPR